MFKYILALILIAGVVLPMDQAKAYAPCSNDCAFNTKYKLLCNQQAVQENALFFPFEQFFQNTSIEFKAAGFYPFKERPRRIYATVWPDLGLEVAKIFYDRLQVWLGVDYIFTNGKSTALRKKTHLNFLPVSLGVNFLFPVNYCVTAYLGAGGVYSNLWLKNHSQFFRKNVNSSGFGGEAKIGLNCCLYDCVNIDTFVNYFYQSFSFKNHKASDGGFIKRNNLDLSGLKLGVGVNVMF